MLDRAEYFAHFAWILAQPLHVHDVVCGRACCEEELIARRVVAHPVIEASTFSTAGIGISLTSYRRELDEAAVIGENSDWLSAASLEVMCKKTHQLRNIMYCYL